MAIPRPLPDSITATFDSLVSWLESRMTELDVPGGAVGVVLGDRRFTHAAGVTTVGTRNAFTTETRFGIASLTKIFTATALASLVHEGALSLDDPVSMYLPDFRLSDPAATAAVTVGHLLSHGGGWADTFEPVPGQDSLGWYATQMAGLRQVVPVGTHFSYSNSGFLLAGAVIEALTGVPYEDAILESVLKPLGMDATRFPSDLEPSANQATGHEGAGNAIDVIPIADIPRAVHPAGGLLSTLEDMLNFVGAHASIDHGQLDPGALASMRQPRSTGGSVGPVVVDHIGTGWMVLDRAGETMLMSQGGDSGLISAMIAVPSRRFGMVLLANSDTAMMLVNDAVLRGCSTFTGLALPEPETFEWSTGQAARAEGQYGLPEWMSFSVTHADSSLHLMTSAGGHEIPDLSGEFAMTSSTRGFMPYLGGRIWLDLIPDHDGSIQWIRFAARMVPRIR